MAITNLDLKAIAQDCLIGSKVMLDPLTAFSTKLTTEVKNARKSDSIFVPVFGDSGDAADFDASTNNYETTTDVNLNGVAVAINKHKKHTTAWSDICEARSDARQWLSKKINAVIRAVQADVYALITSTNFNTTPAYTGAAATFGLDDTSKIEAKALAAGMDPSTLNLVLNTDYYSALLGDPTVLTASAYGTIKSMFNSELPTLNNMAVIRALSLPSNSQNLVGFVTDRTAIAIASGLAPIQDSVAQTVDYQVITEPESGFSIALRTHTSDKLHEPIVTVEAVYGVAKAVSTGLIRLTSA